MDYAYIIFGLRALDNSLLSESANRRRVERIAVYMGLTLDSKLSALLDFFTCHAFPIFGNEAFALLEVRACGCGGQISILRLL